MDNPLIKKIVKKPARLFVIGDIHGCLAETEALVNHLKGPLNFSTEDLLVFIGDYIDRGPDSKGVINLLTSIKSEFPDTVFLKGNHEDMLMDYLGLGGRGADVYAHNGGLSFFRSYGLPAYAETKILLEGIPPEHVDFLKGLDLAVSIAEFLIVHAGFDPLKPLDTQTEEDMLWIRQAFTENTHPFNKTVVFGHTPYEDLMLHMPYKLGIDTGLVYGNKLTCVELVEGLLIQVEAGEREVKTASIQDYISSKSS